MPRRDRFGRTIETPEEATQAENSKDTLFMLVGGLILALIAAAILAWYFEIGPF